MMRLGADELQERITARRDECRAGEISEVVFTGLLKAYGLRADQIKDELTMIRCAR